VHGNVIEIPVRDPGPGSRLGAVEREQLRAALKTAVRESAGCLLLDVQSAAWDQSPSADAEQWTQPVVVDAAGLVRSLFSVGPPVVVSLDGAVSGLGLALALAADLRICSPATTFALGAPQTAAALLGGATWLLEHAIGRASLQHLAWTGSALSAKDALACALVSEIAADPAASARALADRLALVPDQAATSLKRALTSRHRPDLDVTLDYESWLPEIALAPAGSA
jgi:enoyl-CoA hydratase/carnithine racemase